MIGHPVHDIRRGSCYDSRMRRLHVLLLVIASCGTDNQGQDGGTDGSMNGMDGTTNPSDGSGDGMQMQDTGVPTGENVVERNNHPNRDGFFIQPAITKAKAATMVRDTSFDGTISGNVYASPLFVDGKPGMFIIATENNQLTALDENTGKPVWQKSYGTPAGATGAGCGNIGPIGITGTPTIDLAKRTIYFDAAIGTNSTIQDHVVHGVSLDDGSERAGFPISTKAITYMNETFNPVYHNQRSSLLLLNGILYVAFGGHYGDCGPYRGWMIGIATANPQTIKVYKTGASSGGGMWAAGGPSSDGTNVYVTSGNTFGASSWSGGEAILRFQAGPVFSGQATDYFAPSNWKALDNADLDLSGTGPLVVDAPAFTPSTLVVGFGKDGYVYAVDRTNLGGIGAQKALLHVMSGEIINASASYTTSTGTYVVMHGHGGSTGVNCPVGSGGLVAVKLAGTQLAMAWCANNQGDGSPIVTATDAKGTDAVVWTAGAEGSNALHGFDANTGAVVYAGGMNTDHFQNVRRFTSPIAVKGRIILAGDNRVYVYKTQ